MEKVWDFIQTQVLNEFDFSFIAVVILLTYLIIKGIDWVNGDKPVALWGKRLVLVWSILIVALVYYHFSKDNVLKIFNSSILCPVAWSWIFKPICKLLKIDYMNIDETLNK